MKKILLLLCIFISFAGFSQGLETFENLDRTGTSYGDGTFEGQDGSTWTYGQCRGDIEINGKAITLGRNRDNPMFVKSGTLSGGVGTLEFKYKQAFSNNVNVEVYVNDVLVHTATSNNEIDVIKSSGPIIVETGGDFEIKFVNPRNAGQVALDDISWTPHGSVPSDDCDQGDDSNEFEDGIEIAEGGNMQIADDFEVSAGNTLHVRSIVLNLFLEEPVEAVNLVFYNDDNGKPGNTVVHSVSNIVPYAQVAVGASMELLIYAVHLEVDLQFPGGNSGTSYWMSPSAVSDFAYWEITTAGTLGAPYHEKEDGGEFTPNDMGANNVFKLHCDVIDPPPFECIFDVFVVEAISRVSIANVDNPSPSNSNTPVEDFKHIKINAEAGSTHTIKVEGNTSGDYTNYFGAFIDRSGDWQEFDAFPIGSITNSTGNDGKQATAQITIPADLPDGSYTFRVIKNYDNIPPTPCGAYAFGQAEDYTLVVGSATGCTGTPEAGSASVTPSAGNPGSSYTITNSNHDSDTGLMFQWQSRTNSGSWVDEGSPSENYSAITATAPSPMGSTVEWRLAVTCSTSGQTSYSEIATFVVEKTYCIPIRICTDGDLITRVQLTNLDNPSSCSTDGYGDYPYLSATVKSGGTYPLSVTVGAGYDYESVSVWVDYNDNGEFEESEFYYIGTGSGNTVTEDVTIPVGMANGSYRMRVRVAAVGAAGATWDKACDTEQNFGETEDYTLVIDGAVGIADHQYTGLNYYPNPAEDVLNISAQKQIESVSVFNVLGQQVLGTRNFQNGKMDISSLPQGTYMFRIRFETGITETFKIVIK